MELPRHCTLDEYFELDEESDIRLEFLGGMVFPFNGRIIPRAAGTEFHSLIVSNVAGELSHRLRRKPCRVFASDFRLGVRRYPTYSYPDAQVICGPTQFDDRDPKNRTTTNPTLIVEILSKSTEAYDRGGKFERYMHVESFREYVLVTQTKPRVEVFYRQADGTWLLSPYDGLQSVATLRSIEVELPLAEVYLNVLFPPETPGVE